MKKQYVLYMCQSHESGKYQILEPSIHSKSGFETCGVYNNLKDAKKDLKKLNNTKTN